MRQVKQLLYIVIFGSTATFLFDLIAVNGIEMSNHPQQTRFQDQQRLSQRLDELAVIVQQQQAVIAEQTQTITAMQKHQASSFGNNNMLLEAIFNLTPPKLRLFLNLVETKVVDPLPKWKVSYIMVRSMVP